MTRLYKLACGLLLLLAACIGWHLLYAVRLVVSPISMRVAADGREHVVATLREPSAKDMEGVEVTSVADARVEARGSSAVVVMRAPVQGGRQVLRIRWHGQQRSLPVTFAEDDQTSPQQPGLPDWMVLHDPADRTAFRQWFTEMAERAADDPPGQLPGEITDCASLLRYAYREALRQHDDKWYAGLSVGTMPEMLSVQQWAYPNTPLGLGLFRTRPGRYMASDRTDGTFAQFADAKTLSGLNAHLVSRDLRQARPGDLIFYRLLELDAHNESQYHSMVITGEYAEWVVYHTGPINHGKGEMRRVLLADLLRHPDPRWRPEPANTNFLGVFRWDILTEDR
jgi:uncharacterized protein